MNGSRKVISITVILVLAQTFLSPFGPLGMSGLNSSSYGVENILSVATHFHPAGPVASLMLPAAHSLNARA
jgi:hypothetical protein